MKNFFLLSIVILFIANASCKKRYPDDTYPHIHSPHQRLTKHDWKFESYKWLVNCGYTPYVTLSKEKFVFSEDGQIEGSNSGVCITPDCSQITSSSNFNFNGYWYLVDNDSKLRIVDRWQQIISCDWQIIQLDKNHLHLKNDSLEIYFYFKK